MLYESPPLGGLGSALLVTVQDRGLTDLQRELLEPCSMAGEPTTVSWLRSAMGAPADSAIEMPRRQTRVVLQH
jgi:hypothetical protein